MTFSPDMDPPGIEAAKSASMVSRSLYTTQHVDRVQCPR